MRNFELSKKRKLRVGAESHIETEKPQYKRPRMEGFVFIVVKKLLYIN